MRVWYNGHLQVRKKVSEGWRRWDFLFAFGSQRDGVTAWPSNMFNAVLRVQQSIIDSMHQHVDTPQIRQIVCF